MQGLTFVVFVILARLLTPADIGVVALALVFVAFAQLVVDQGLGDALIQKAEVTQRQMDTAFWASIATGLILMVVMIVAAVPIAAILDEPLLEPMLRVLSVTFLLAGLSSIQLALLRRELRFKAVALRALLGTFAGGVVGIAMALAGMGAWALIGQQIGTGLVQLAVLWGASSWRPGFQLSRVDFRDLFAFGIHVMGGDILAFLSRNTDNLLIGTVLGKQPLGLYAVGYRILGMSQSILITVARRIAFPAFAQLQANPARMRRAYVRATRIAATLILPGYIGLAVVAPELTVTLVGQQWAASGPVASVLLLIGPVLTIQAFSGSYLNAAGYPEVVFRFRLLTTVLNVLGFVIAVNFGILAVAAAFVVRGYLLLPLNLYWMRRYGGIAIGHYLQSLRSIALATAVMAVAMILAKPVLASADPWLSLTAQLLVGSTMFVGAILVIDRHALTDALRLGREILPVGRNSESAGSNASNASNLGQ